MQGGIFKINKRACTSIRHTRVIIWLILHFHMQFIRNVFLKYHLTFCFLSRMKSCKIMWLPICCHLEHLGQAKSKYILISFVSSQVRKLKWYCLNILTPKLSLSLLKSLSLKQVLCDVYWGSGLLPTTYLCDGSTQIPFPDMESLGPHFSRSLAALLRF